MLGRSGEGVIRVALLVVADSDIGSGGTEVVHRKDGLLLFVVVELEGAVFVAIGRFDVAEIIGGVGCSRDLRSVSRTVVPAPDFHVSILELAVGETGDVALDRQILDNLLEEGLIGRGRKTELCNILRERIHRRIDIAFRAVISDQMKEITNGFDLLSGEFPAVVLLVERSAVFPDFLRGDGVGDLHGFRLRDQAVQRSPDRNRNRGPEGSGREIVLIDKIGRDVVIPCVTDHIGFGNLVAGESRLVAAENGGGGIVAAVGPGNFKVFGRFAVFGLQGLRVAERDNRLAVFDLQRFEERRIRDKVLLPVCILQSQKSKTRSDILFVPRMNVAEVSDVVGDRHRRVRVLVRESLLSLPEDRKSVRIAVVERRKLNKIKPIDDSIYSLMMKAEKIFFVEESIKSGSVGEIFGCGLSEHGVSAKFFHIAINDEFVKQASVESQMKKYKLDCNSIIEEVKNAQK